MDQGYTSRMLEHFRNPRNTGEVADADGVGEVGNPACGDLMKITIRVDGGRLAEVKWRTLGCGAAIATSSAMTELATGRTLEDALALTREQVAEALGGLPKEKMHCSNLAADGLRAAIRDYLAKRGEGS